MRASRSNAAAGTARPAVRRAGHSEGAKQSSHGESHGSGGAALHGEPERDETLQHPRCVFQVLKRHFARYTPELVEQVCGIPPELFAQVAEALVANSGRERTTAFAYAVGWTQHTVGVQYIRTAAILQTLLGNIGRPGGGILALRGHASIQGSTDIPTLYNLLPGYIPMPHAHEHGRPGRLRRRRRRHARASGATCKAYTVSLLKAYWGEAATEANDYCFGYLPRLTGDHSTMTTVMHQIDQGGGGYFIVGENPAVGSTNAKMQRMGMANLDWLVVRDFSLIESATFWKDGPEIETGELRTADIKTEVFFLPAAAHTEKNGSFTNTQRMLQWHHQAVEPAGDTRSDLWFYYHLGRIIRQKLAGSTDPRDRPLLDLTWDYPTEGPLAEPSAEAVLAEINGFDAEGKPLSGYTALKDDGSTSSGCWIYCGVYADGVNQAARRKPGSEQSWVAPEWAWAWPMNRRILYNRASADPAGKPWSERKAYVWWDERAAEVDRARRARLRGDQAAGLRAAAGRQGAGRDARRRPVHHAGRRQGVAVRAGRARRRPAAGALRAAGVAVRQPAVQPAGEPGAGAVPAQGQPLRARPAISRARGVPVRAHHLPADRAPHRRRDEPLAALPVRAAAGVLLRGVAGTGRRAGPAASRLGHHRDRPVGDRGAGCSSPTG